MVLEELTYGPSLGRMHTKKLREGVEVVISGGGQRARETAGAEGAPGEVAAHSTACRGQRPRSVLETAECQDPLEVRVC